MIILEQINETLYFYESRLNMNLTVKLAEPHEAHIIKNLYPLYLHDLSGHYGLNDGLVLNEHGIYEDDHDIQTLAQQYDVQNIWWEKPGCLYPFLFRADLVPAGFALIATPPHCAPGVDYFVNEFLCFSRSAEPALPDRLLSRCSNNLKEYGSCIRTGPPKILPGRNSGARQ